jgi:hypothetical protein
MSAGYTIDGNDFWSTYNVKVTSVTGIHDLLARKGETEQSWPDSDGVEAFTDADDIYFEPRDITLQCLMVCANRNTFYQKFNALKLVLQASGTHTLNVPYNDIDYTVYCRDGARVEIATKWASGVAHQVVARFALTFRETAPARSYL